MISTINKALINVISFMPIELIKLFSNRYIAGTNINSALKAVKKINSNNLSATIDILGEHTKTLLEAKQITAEYIQLYRNIKSEKLDCNISLKPSHIGSDINNECFEQNLNKIHKVATENNNFLRIDMENSLLTNLTIKTFFKEYKYGNNIGIVIQAYLYRSIQDIQNLKPGMNIRLCKGIYNEKEKISIKDPIKINKNYIELLNEAFNKELYLGIATHDISLLNEIIKIINKKNINKNTFEFQVLYGVPMGNMIDELLNQNFKVRVYIPFGKDWYDYSIRRLKENPNIIGYIIKNLFKKNFYK